MGFTKIKRIKPLPLGPMFVPKHWVRPHEAPRGQINKDMIQFEMRPFGTVFSLYLSED